MSTVQNLFVLPVLIRLLHLRFLHKGKNMIQEAKTPSYKKLLVSNKPIQLPTITGPLGLTPTTQSGPNPGPVSASSSTKGIVLLQISRDMVYDPRKIDFASLSLPSTNKSTIKQK